MATRQKAKNDARLNFRLNARQKKLIDQAALVSGQSTSDFATSTLLEKARRVVEHTTVLSNRDRDLFLAMLESDSGPNAALLAAAKRYKERNV